MSAEARSIVRLAYETMLGRPPDPAGEAFYMEQVATGGADAVARLYANLGNSDEFLTKILSGKDYSVVRVDHGAASDASLFAHPKYNALPFADAFPSEKFKQLYLEAEAVGRAIGPLGIEYCRLHKERFRELFGLLATVCRPGMRVAEVSTSPVSGLIAKTFGVHYVSVDHPSIHQRVADAQHISVDLNSARLAAKLDIKIDLVIYCEIIEHLLTSPYDQIRDLADCLAPGGYLFVSTPNFFSHERLRKMNHRIHPSPMLPAGETYLNGAHHVREFSMSELVSIMEATGLEIVTFEWSACWDQGRDIHPHERTNLHILARRA